MKNSFAQLLSPAKDILVLLPNRPHLDQVASGLSLFLSLKQTKNVTIASSNPMTVEFSRLVGVDNITKELGNKNLIIEFPGYNPEHVEKVSADIDNNQFKLTFLPKAGFKPPEKSQVVLNYAGISADLVILIGGGDETHFEMLKNPELVNLNLVHVGTRLLEISTDLKVLSFARQASSTSEIVYSLIKESGLPVDSDIATNLLAGIEDGSRSFQDDGVSADTFAYFAELLKVGGKRLPKLMPQKFPVGSIPNKPYNTNLGQVGQVEQVVEEDIPMPEVEPKDIPSSWSEPKIFTGTSVS
jgi:hypothetical protein